jgi:hypothetical protein
VIGQCPNCGNWHTNPYSCPSQWGNQCASEPLRDWRDVEIDRLRAENAALQKELNLANLRAFGGGVASRRLGEEIAALREAVGNAKIMHSLFCAKRVGKDCDCGVTDLRALLEKP